MLSTRGLSEALGAEVIGLDLRSPIDDEFGRILAAFHQHQVLVFRHQNISPEEHITFSRRFGRLDVHVKSEYLLPDHCEILILSNKRRSDGSRIGFEDAGRYWHSDVSYTEEPALGSILHAIELPAAEGDTLFCNMYLAYETLPDDMKARIESLEAVHSYTASFEGRTAASRSNEKLSDAQRSQLREVAHPVARTHPETGRRALYVNPGFTFRIKGLDDAESEELLAELFRHSIQDEFVYRHRWREHDLVLWDNRCTMHRATVFDPKYVRHMHRTTIRGTSPYLSPAP